MIRLFKVVYLLPLFFGLSGCMPLYKAPSNLTPETGASLSGIVNPMPNLFATGAHICINNVDGAGGASGSCADPVLLTPGPHTIQISADFHPFPAEFGFGTVNANLLAGGTYYIRAAGGPIAITNSNGHVSAPAPNVTVWIESDTGSLVSNRATISLQGPTPIPILVPLK